MSADLADFGGGLDAPEWAADVVDDSLTGYLIDCGTDNERLKLLRCPVCGRRFDRDYAAALNDPLATHLWTHHEPADFGLSERGERR
jgi:uncharacterized C2H2 Zn-finger protein